MVGYLSRLRIALSSFVINCGSKTTQNVFADKAMSKEARAYFR